MEHIYIQTSGKDKSLELASKKHWKQGCVWDPAALHDRPILLHVSSLPQNIYSFRNRIIFTLFHKPWRSSFSPVFCIQGQWSKHWDRSISFLSLEVQIHVLCVWQHQAALKEARGGCVLRLFCLEKEREILREEGVLQAVRSTPQEKALL